MVSRDNLFNVDGTDTHVTIGKLGLELPLLEAMNLAAWLSVVIEPAEIFEIASEIEQEQLVSED